VGRQKGKYGHHRAIWLSIQRIGRHHAVAWVDHRGVEHDLSWKVEDLERELAEARRREAATNEVLGVISSSPTDVQPVFMTIVRSAVRLCDGLFSGVYHFDGELLHHIAHHNYSPEALEEVHRKFPTRPTRDFGTERAILEGTVVHNPDVEIDPEYRNQPLSRAVGMRSGLFVLMLRQGARLGVIVVTRAEPGPFSESQIELLKTFAEQAVIAIENTRLFQAEQTRTRELTERTKELTETLEHQTVTSDVLGIISRSPNELQPVFDGIVATAQRLCEAYDASIVLRDGERLKLKAHVGPIPMRAEWPLGNRGLVASRSVMDRKTVHVHDLAAAEGEFAEGREDALKLGHRSILTVPLVHKDEGIGTLIVRRFEVRPFSDRQIALLAAVSSFAMRGDEEKARASGCDHYVTKPYSPLQLLRIIRGFLCQN
jgi:two-component system, NtrC family, sensor kinase